MKFSETFNKLQLTQKQYDIICLCNIPIYMTFTLEELSQSLKHEISDGHHYEIFRYYVSDKCYVYRTKILTEHEIL